jgi:hypothetical protein
MKKCTLFMMFLFFSSLLYGEYSFRSQLFVPWGHTEKTVWYEEAPGGRFGPTAFRVTKDDIQILDARNQSVKIFQNDSLIRQRPFRCPTADDFILENGDLYLLSSNHVKKSVDGKFIPVYKPESFRERITGLYDSSSENIYLPSASGKTFVLDKTKGEVTKTLEGTAIRENNPVQIQFQPGNPIHIRIESGKTFTLNVENPGLVRLIGTDGNGDLYFYIERILQGGPLEVERFILVTTGDGFEHSRIHVPVHMWTEIFREFQVDESGNIHHMISTEEGIHIISWTRTTGDDKTFHEYHYPEKLDRHVHYNQLIDESWEGKPENPQTAPAPKGVTRDEALAIADTYVQHVWNCRAENLTNGRITVNGIEVETPPWIEIGQNQKIPYKWGGFHTLDQYDSGLLNNKYAGDIATSGVSSAAVGVDCSGYVSRCWKLIKHYSTTDMNSNTTLFTKILDWNQFLPADAMHKVGHVRLGVARNADGSILAVEAAGSSTGWKVDYRNYTLANLSDYTLLKYTGMSGGVSYLSQPELLTVSSLPGDSVFITWTPFSGEGNETDVKIIFDSIDGTIPTVSDTLIPLHLNSVAMPKPADPLFVTLISVDKDGNESMPSDTYGTSGMSEDNPFLIVDGFTRTGSGASYVLPYHDFALAPANALSNWDIPYQTCTAKAVTDGLVSLEEYRAVFWNTGDESTIDESFSDEEQGLIKTYLQQGGRFAATGSEIAWDLDNKGSSTDKDFIRNYLKAAYQVDDAGNVPVKLQTGPFTGVLLEYDNGAHGVYEEDYPDGLSSVNGGSAFLEYQSSPRYTAGVSFHGTAPEGTAECRTALVGFPFETVWENEEQILLMATLLWELGFDEYPLHTQTPEIPGDFVLHGNYPNPFNATTVIRFSLAFSADVSLTLYDLAGREIRSLIQKNCISGPNALSLDLSGLPSGLYLYSLTSNAANQHRIGKMTLVK